jgi:hypothetical protein
MTLSLLKNMQGFKEEELGKIFDLSISKTNDSNFTKAFIHQNRGKIPVYGATKISNYAGYGYIKEGLQGILYFKDCLTFNIDGSIGCFFRNGDFSLSEKVIPLYVKNQYQYTIDSQYIANIIKIACNNYGFGFNLKPNRKRISELILKIPITQTGEFDLQKQKEIAKRFELIEKMQNRITEAYDVVKRVNVVIDLTSIVTKDIFIEDIFDILTTKKQKIKSIYKTDKYSIPVYSAQTTNYGIVGYTDIADFYADSKNKLITFGDHTRKFFIRNSYFSTTDNVKVLKLKEEFEGRIDIEYFIFNADRLIANIGYARHWSEAKITAIPMPIDYDGNYDVDTQKQIAKKYKTIEKMQNYLKENLKILKNCSVIPNFMYL